MMKPTPPDISAVPSITRRGFIGGAAAALGSAALTRPAHAQSDIAAPVVLGRTGETVSRFGFGCAPLQRMEITVEDAAAMLHRAVELGVTYFDTAPNYGSDDQLAEEKMGPAVKELRDRMFLVTKTEDPTYDGTWNLIRQSMKRMQTDRLDLVHLHNVGLESRFENLDEALSNGGALGALRDAKKQGVVRFIGASGHLHPSRFDRVMDEDDVDVLMNAVNYVVQHTYNFEGKVWPRARKQNLGLVAMKVLGGQARTGFRLPSDAYEDAIRYAVSIPGCHVCVIGVASIEELEQAVDTVSNAKPLSDKEQTKLAAAGKTLSSQGRWPVAYGEPLT